MKQINAPFEKGQLVTTSFYPVEKDIPRTVTRCYQSTIGQSGWLVDTVNDKGKHLKALDSKWYQPAGAHKHDLISEVENHAK